MRPFVFRPSRPCCPSRLLQLWLTVFCLLLPVGCTTRYVWEQPSPPKPARETPPPKVQAPQYPVYYVAASRLNLRACPGMDCPKISRMERNQEVEKLDESQDWYQIRSRTDGTVGWVNKRYLSQSPVTEPIVPTVATPGPGETPATKKPETAKPSETPATKKPETAKPAEKATPSKPPTKKAEEKKEVTPRVKKAAPVEEEEEEEAPAVVQKSPPATETATPTTAKQPVSTGTPPPATSAPATPAEPKAKRVRIM